MATPMGALITEDMMYQCGKMGLRLPTIGNLYGLTQQRIGQLLKKPHLRAAYERGRAELELAIVGAQIDQAVNKRSTTMLIWTGKQFCGQRDDPVEQVDDGKSVQFIAEWGRSNEEITAGERLEIEGHIQEEDEDE